jgi:hypothetical protein
MTIGPEPMIGIFLRSVRLGTQAPAPPGLLVDQPIDDRRLRHGLFTAVEDVVQATLTDPDDLAVPQSCSPRTLMRRSTRSRIAWASRDVSLVVVNDVHSGFWPVPSVFR